MSSLFYCDDVKVESSDFIYFFGFIKIGCLFFYPSHSFFFPVNLYTSYLEAIEIPQEKVEYIAKVTS